MVTETPLKEEVKKDIEKFTAGRKSKPEQPNLFGDQDFVFNVLQTELTDIDDEMVKTREAIEKKEEKLEKLHVWKEEVSKAAEIVANRKKELKKKTKKEGNDGKEKEEPTQKG